MTYAEQDSRTMIDPKPSSRRRGGWVLALIAGIIVGALLALLVLQERLLGAFWSFSG